MADLMSKSECVFSAQTPLDANSRGLDVFLNISVYPQNAFPTVKRCSHIENLRSRLYTPSYLLKSLSTGLYHGELRETLFIPYELGTKDIAPANDGCYRYKNTYSKIFW